MTCPECNGTLMPIATKKHYGLPIEIDQCDSCGGVWFDENEFHQVDHESALEIDTEKLSATKTAVNDLLSCPKDGTELIMFKDPSLPKGLVIDKCPSCQGTWFNKGELSEFRNGVHGRTGETERTLEDKPELQKLLKQLEGDEARYDQVSAIANFLKTPVGMDDRVNRVLDHGLSVSLILDLIINN